MGARSQAILKLFEQFRRRFTDLLVENLYQR